jgi:hypothetical protein
MTYFSRGLNITPFYNSLISKLRDENFCLTRLSLEPRFKNLLYKYNNIKHFNEKILLTGDSKMYQNFKSNNISIKYDKHKYLVTSKDNIVSGNLYTALSILSLENEKNKPIFLMDHFNISDITYMKHLEDEFSPLKLYFNLTYDYQVIPFKVQEVDEYNIYIKKYCTSSQLESSLDKINTKYDTFYTFKNNSIEYKDTLLRYYNIIDVEEGLYLQGKDYMFPKSLDIDQFVFLRP